VRSAVGASALRSDPRSTVVLRATAAASLALAVSELSLVAALVEATGFAASDAALCAWLFSSAFFASDVAVAFGASALGAGCAASSALAGFTVSSAFGAGCAVSSAFSAALLASDCALTSCAATVST
jgi:hypothetical protein